MPRGALPGLFSTYTLFHAQSGVPLASIDGNELTSRRTAAGLGAGGLAAGGGPMRAACWSPVPAAWPACCRMPTARCSRRWTK